MSRSNECGVLQDPSRLQLEAVLQGVNDINVDAVIDGDLDYIAGCGIVAESDPEAEWRESLDKAEVLRRTISRASGAVRREASSNGTFAD